MIGRYIVRNIFQSRHSKKNGILKLKEVLMRLNHKAMIPKYLFKCNKLDMIQKNYKNIKNEYLPEMDSPQIC